MKNMKKKELIEKIQKLEPILAKEMAFNFVASIEEKRLKGEIEKLKIELEESDNLKLKLLELEKKEYDARVIIKYLETKIELGN